MPEAITKQIVREKDASVPDDELPNQASVVRRHWLLGEEFSDEEAVERFGIGPSRLPTIKASMEGLGYKFSKRTIDGGHKVRYRLLNPKHTPGAGITPAAPKRQRKQPTPKLPNIGAQVEVVMASLDGPTIAVRGDAGQWLCQIVGFQPAANDEEG